MSWEYFNRPFSSCHHLSNLRSLGYTHKSSDLEVATKTKFFIFDCLIFIYYFIDHLSDHWCVPGLSWRTQAPDTEKMMKQEKARNFTYVTEKTPIPLCIRLFKMIVDFYAKSCKVCDFITQHDFMLPTISLQKSGDFCAECWTFCMSICMTFHLLLLWKF